MHVCDDYQLIFFYLNLCDKSDYVEMKSGDNFISYFSGEGLWLNRTIQSTFRNYVYDRDNRKMNDSSNKMSCKLYFIWLFIFILFILFRMDWLFGKFLCAHIKLNSLQVTASMILNAASEVHFSILFSKLNNFFLSFFSPFHSVIVNCKAKRISNSKIRKYANAFNNKIKRAEEMKEHIQSPLSMLIQFDGGRNAWAVVRVCQSPMNLLRQLISRLIPQTTK